MSDRVAAFACLWCDSIHCKKGFCTLQSRGRTTYASSAAFALVSLAEIKWTKGQGFGWDGTWCKLEEASHV